MLRDFEPENEQEQAEHNKRKRALFANYLLRRPLYQNIIKPKILEPLLKKIVPFEFVRSGILNIIDYNVCYSVVV